MMAVRVKRRMDSWVYYQIGLVSKTKSIREGEFSDMCVGSLINWCGPKWDKMVSILLSSYVA